MDYQKATAEVSRKGARIAGLARYYTGKPCVNGHVSERLVTNGTCIYCANERKRKWHNDNREAVMQRLSVWHKSNREQANRNAKKCHDKKKDERLAWGREYRANNKALFAAKSQKRLADKRKRTPVWYGEIDEFVMQEAAALCVAREKATGFAWHADHIIPMMAREACGLHCAANIQVIPASTNVSKGRRMIFTEPLEWARNGQ